MTKQEQLKQINNRIKKIQEYKDLIETHRKCLSVEIETYCPIGTDVMFDPDGDNKYIVGWVSDIKGSNVIISSYQKISCVNINDIILDEED